MSPPSLPKGPVWPMGVVAHHKLEYRGPGDLQQTYGSYVELIDDHRQ